MFEREAELVRLILCLHDKGCRYIIQVDGNSLVYGHYMISYHDTRMEEILMLLVDDLKQILNDYDQMDNFQFILSYGKDPFGFITLYDFDSMLNDLREVVKNYVH